ncbi:ATP-binding protein [Piscinibacter sp. XHJ-5]|uniref:ATP-binding protein n=1 Tax=Piscinibacter sp. XHJ-5 TaxID=3037797 RepID=UPI002453645A|nr:ATP-binding protein [Piscinibacter sp. XHJ-5]
MSGTTLISEPAAIARPPRRHARWAWRACLGLVLIALVAWAAHALAMQRGLQRLSAAAQQRLEVEAARLDGQLSRFEYLPSLLETSPEVLRLLAMPADGASRESVSRYLKALNAIAGADNLYVLDRAGTALAAADFEQPGTPVGQDLSYRPYVRDALASGRGAFYGVGITSARAGYYLSYALPARGEARGVATVKVDLQAIEQEWRDLPGELLMLDEHGVVILASRDAWKYHPLAPVSADAREEASRSRRYGSADLAPLDWQVREHVAERAARALVDARPYLVSEHVVNRGRWRLLLLDDEASARSDARWVAISAGLGAAVLLLAVTLAIQRRREIRQRLANREALQAAHDSLERKVQERTAELRSAQYELVHAGKLAVLGQMSAGMVHELNQPLAALHTLSDNAALLIDRGRLDEASGNLARISHLVHRLGRLTSQLKVFAHKSNEPIGTVSVHKAVQEAVTLVAARLREGGIDVSVQVEPRALAVAGDEARLEQVLGNLLGNAVDALDGAEVRRIDIRAARQGAMCEIVVRNSGPCIDPDILPRLFEPFVTSKPPGKGLGLGLVISAHIVKAFGGSLRASNLAPTGAEFTIELPCAGEA